MSARFWFGRGKFPEKADFAFGTVCAETAGEAREKLGALWREAMPFDPPDFEPEPGMIRVESE